MMELISSWVMGITCAAMVVALAESMTPEGTVKKIGRLVGGLVMLIAVVSPVLKLEEADLAGALAQYRAELEEYTYAFEGANREIAKSIIEEQTAAYILDKAAELGITDCAVTVSCEYVDGDFPVPTSVRVTGTFTADQESRLARAITADFGIPTERQEIERTGEP